MTTPGSNKRQVVCKNCKSNQIVSNKRGYSFKKMFLTFLILFIIGLLSLFGIVNSLASSSNNLFSGMGEFLVVPTSLLFLALPLGLIAGLFGRSNLINGCMNCGHKWQPK